MLRWPFLVACLGLALAQSPRWSGAPDYFAVPGSPTPAGSRLDRSYVLSFPAQGAPKGTLIMVPGFLGGATNFEALARRLVLAAPGWTVWAWDRRANGLEDRQGFALPDPWAYYQDYRLPDFPFLKEWGLRVHLEDLEQLVEQARREGPVVLAGHSLGASLAALFALYRGERLDGLILLDGAPRLLAVDPRAYLEGAQGPFGRLPGLNDLLSGRTPPYVAAFGLGPAALAQAEAQAFMAGLAPEADAPPGWAPFRSSRLAAALYRVDERYSLLPIFSVSAGQAVAREGLSLLGLALGRLVYTIRGPRGGRVEWRDTGEATDPLEFVRLYANPITGFSEWFFPYRLALDIAAFEVVLPDLRPRRLPYPVLALGAGRGLLPRNEDFASARAFFPETPLEVNILEGLTHLDLLTNRHGAAIGPIRNYLEGLQRAHP
ncbi:MAG: lysophospholipase [Meiothermus sp.]|uniref:alpha/beta hydrolase n=1 Tax=Meiothermus sp. TaxID=1955249 RepID=UPI0025F0C463|nr:alpha/beta fold hydrolase [Meiothermus sp.]MCS7193357.1 lysophospholipase [Meiothermus sp.]MDW8091764.1 alpha/beta fold hydrolase [Meiothermus sp.]MDW8480568.1 alpha/beta fold hydrolase [Meiothermus sp.]